MGKKENSLVEAANPHLSTIKTMKMVLQDLEKNGKPDPDPVWNQLEQARFNVYKSLSTRDAKGAREWFKSLKAARESISPGALTGQQSKRLDRAISCIWEIIENKEGWGP